MSKSNAYSSYTPVTRDSYLILRARRAVTALEYGLIASLVALAIIGGVASLGTHLSTTFSKVTSAINHTP